VKGDAMPRPIALRSAEAGKPPRRPHRGPRKRKSAHTAHGDLEQMRALMQVVPDNMTDGVTLYDS